MIFKPDLIKWNLSICLKENAFIWHTIELTKIFRKIFIYEKNVEEWVQTLIQKFKQQIATATANFLKKSYIINNVWKLRKSKKICLKNNSIDQNNSNEFNVQSTKYNLQRNKNQPQKKIEKINKHTYFEWIFKENERMQKNLMKINQQPKNSEKIFIHE